MKNILKTVGVLFTTALILSGAGLFSKEVSAKDQSYYRIKQTDQTETTVTIDWNDYIEESSSDSPVSDQELIVYENYDEKDTPLLTIPIEDSSKRSYTIKDLAPGSRYFVDYKAKPTLSSGYGSELSTNIEVYTLPGKVQGVKQTKWWYWALNCDVEWDEQTGVDGYEYVVKDHKKKEIDKNDNLSSYNNTVSFKVDNNSVYNIKVRAYTELNGKKYFGEWSDTAYCFTQPMINKVSFQKGKMTVKWNKVNGSDHYTVYVSTSETEGYKKVKKVKASETSLVLTKVNGKAVSSKNTYYFYIVGSKKVKGKEYTSGKHYTQQIKYGNITTNWTF